MSKRPYAWVIASQFNLWHHNQSLINCLSDCHFSNRLSETNAKVVFQSINWLLTMQSTASNVWQRIKSVYVNCWVSRIPVFSNSLYHTKYAYVCAILAAKETCWFAILLMPEYVAMTLVGAAICSCPICFHFLIKTELANMATISLAPFSNARSKRLFIRWYQFLIAQLAINIFLWFCTIQVTILHLNRWWLS